MGSGSVVAWWATVWTERDRQMEAGPERNPAIEKGGFAYVGGIGAGEASSAGVDDESTSAAAAAAAAVTTASSVWCLVVERRETGWMV